MAEIMGNNALNEYLSLSHLSFQEKGAKNCDLIQQNRAFPNFIWHCSKKKTEVLCESHCTRYTVVPQKEENKGTRVIDQEGVMIQRKK